MHRLNLVRKLVHSNAPLQETFKDNKEKSDYPQSYILQSLLKGYKKTHQEIVINENSKIMAD